ncbi:MAG: CBS domain-containing protein [Chitinophagaceae bacterium]|jgi:signal-transduction protein with cAMP-binding, CBS, and nucleotidyltransferase domain|nr:CBS domain-containing protein [Chitinophagaceae bacterium]
MRTVKDIFDSKPKVYNTISPDTLVITALEELNTINLSYLIVIENDEYKGIFCERDYSRNVILKGRASKDTKVKDVMSIDLPVVDMKDTVENCMNLMNSHKTRYLLAFDDLRFVGVVTIHDLLRQVLANKELVFDNTITQKLLDNEESGRIY